MLSIGQMSKLASAAYDVAVERYGAAHALPVLEMLSDGMMKFASVGGNDLLAYFEVADREVTREFVGLCKQAGVHPDFIWDASVSHDVNPWHVVNASMLMKQANVLKTVGNAASQVVGGAKKLFGVGGAAATKPPRSAFTAAHSAAKQQATTQSNLNKVNLTMQNKTPRGSFSGQGGTQSPTGNQLNTYTNRKGKTVTPSKEVLSDPKFMQQQGITATPKTQTVTTGSGKTYTSQLQRTDPNARQLSGEALQKRKAELMAKNKPFEQQQLAAQNAARTPEQAARSQSSATNLTQAQREQIQLADQKAYRRTQQRQTQAKASKNMEQRQQNLKKGLQGGHEGMAGKGDLAKGQNYNARQAAQKSYDAHLTNTGGLPANAQPNAYKDGLKAHQQQIQQQVAPSVRNQVTKTTNTGIGAANVQSRPAGSAPEATPWSMQGMKDTARGAWAVAKPWAVPTAIAGGVGVGGYAAYNAARGGAQDQMAQQHQYYPQGYSY